MRFHRSIPVLDDPRSDLARCPGEHRNLWLVVFGNQVTLGVRVPAPFIFTATWSARLGGAGWLQ